jgi:hypothetical protein
LRDATRSRRSRSKVKEAISQMDRVTQQNAALVEEAAAAAESLRAQAMLLSATVTVFTLEAGTRAHPGAAPARLVRPQQARLATA